MNTSETRYFTWRSAIAQPIWQLDRHWYVMLGQLHLGSPVQIAVEWADTPRPTRANAVRIGL